MKRWRAAVIGGGFIGRVHAEALHRLPQAELTALCDPEGAQQKAEAWNVPHAYADYRELVEQERPEVVHICTPNATHYEIAKFALEHGAHVLCEKPFVLHLWQAQELTALARARGLANGINFHNRFYPMVAQLRACVQQWQLGKIFTVHGSYLQDWLLFDTDYSWRVHRETGGYSRAVADIGSHWLDLAEYTTGLRVTEVLAEFSTVHPVRMRPGRTSGTFGGTGTADGMPYSVDTEDCALLLLRFDTGAVGRVVISQVFAGKKNELSFSVAGSAASAMWNSERPEELWMGRRPAASQLLCKTPEQLMDAPAALACYPGGHIEGFSEAVLQGCAQFYAGLEAPCAEYAYADFAAGLRGMQLCEAICTSARSGRWTAVETETDA